MMTMMVMTRRRVMLAMMMSAPMLVMESDALDVSSSLREWSILMPCQVVGPALHSVVVRFVDGWLSWRLDSHCALSPCFVGVAIVCGQVPFVGWCSGPSFSRRPS